MKNLGYLLIIALLISAGCAPQAVQIRTIGSIDTVPKKTYTAYFYGYGEADLFRAVLLKAPESDVEIIPYSRQISTGRSSFEDAMAFMQRGRAYRRVDAEEVIYKGKTVGYLLTYPRYVGAFSKPGSIDIGLYEKEGKIYFSVLENFLYQ